MEESNYKIFKKWVEDINFEVLILEIPEDELEDKLIYMPRDEGNNVTKESFHQHLMFMCVANVQQLAYAVQNSIPDSSEYSKIRDAIVNHIIKVNPKLDPEKLVINKNGLVKLKKSDGLTENDRLINDHKNWDSDDGADNVGDLQDYNAYKVGDDGTYGTREDLHKSVEKKWWKKLNCYIEIKKFDASDLKKLVSGKKFYDASTFRTFAVTTCVVDYKDLFVTLDEEGISRRIHPQVLMRELFELCKEVNPFFTYSSAQELFDGPDEDCGSCGIKRKDPTKKMSTYTAGCGTEKNKQKLRFKDITKETLLSLGDEIKTRVIGQDESIDSLVKAIQRASVGLKDPVKPIGSFLFAGRSGVGKSYSSKVLAEKLTGSRNNIVVIDCSEFSADHEYSKLIGAPSGYVGHEQGGMLTNAVQKTPFSVVVFDEIEKANEKIRELLLQILEEGRLTDGKGKQVSFKDTLIIMTSNIGVAEIDEVSSTIGFGDVAKITDTKKNKAIEKAIKKKFKPEFINRIDAIIYFNNLTKQDYMKIIDLELHRLNDNLRENNTDYKGIALKFEVSIKNLVYKNGIDDNYGARPLKRCIEREVSDPLAMKLLSGDTNYNGIMLVKSYRGKVTFKWEEVLSQEDVLKCHKVNF